MKTRTARISTKIADSESPKKTTASSVNIVNPKPILGKITTTTTTTLTNLQRLKARNTPISTKIADSESPKKTTASSVNIVDPKPILSQIGVISRGTKIEKSTMIIGTNLQRLKARNTPISTKIAVSESTKKTTASSAIIVNPKQILTEIGEKALPTTNFQQLKAYSAQAPALPPPRNGPIIKVITDSESVSKNTSSTR